jgi:hypothetical protein
MWNVPVREAVSSTGAAHSWLQDGRRRMYSTLIQTARLLLRTTTAYVRAWNRRIIRLQCSYSIVWNTVSYWVFNSIILIPYIAILTVFRAVCIRMTYHYHTLVWHPLNTLTSPSIRRTPYTYTHLPGRTTLLLTYDFFRIIVPIRWCAELTRAQTTQFESTHEYLSWHINGTWKNHS